MLVMVFSVGALMLVTTMLALADTGAKTSGELERHKNIQAVLKAGIAAAINEINRDVTTSSGNYDPDSDGVGALTGYTGTPGDCPGVPVTVTLADGTTTRTLGYYRVTVREVGGKDVLTILAAWPSFTAPANQRLLAAAELEIAKTDPIGPDRPFNIAGEFSDDTNLDFDFTNGNKLRVDGVDEHTTDPANVPAANITDSTAESAFLTNFANEAFRWEGADKNDPSVTASTRADSLTNEASPVMNATNMEKVRQFYANLVDEKADTTLPLGTSSFTSDTDLGDGVFIVPSDLQVGSELRGSGTLIIDGSLQVNHSGRLIWDGDVIVTNFDGVAGVDGNHDLNGGSQVQTASGAKFEITGNLIMLAASGQNTQFQIQGGSAGGSTVDGAFLMLSSATSNAQIQIQNGGDLEIDGIFAMYAKQIQYQNQGANGGAGSKFNSNSMNLVFPDGDPASNQLQMQFDNGTQTNLKHNSKEVREATEGLVTALDPPSRVAATSYWEQGVQTVLTAQEAQFSADPNGPWGCDD